MSKKTYVLKIARPNVVRGNPQRALSRLLGSFLAERVAQRLLSPPCGLVRTATAMKPPTKMRSSNMSSQRKNLGAPPLRQKLMIIVEIV